MPADDTASTWRSIREYAESLAKEAPEWDLIWSSRPRVNLAGVLSNWDWWHPRDESLCARADTAFLRVAKELGYNSGYLWLDELRYKSFAGFEVNSFPAFDPRLGYIDDELGGVLRDVLKHVITVCDQQIADAAPPKRVEPQQPDPATTPDPGGGSERSEPSAVVAGVPTTDPNGAAGPEPKHLESAAAVAQSRSTAKQLKQHRGSLVEKFRKEQGITMADLHRHVGHSITAIYGMINGDTSRYDEGALSHFLERINVTREVWDLAS